jgi:hypothetical protein
MTDISHLEQARMVWQHAHSIYHKHIPLLFLEVSGLPKGALIEWQFVVGTDLSSADQQDEDELLVSGPAYISESQPTFYGCHSRPSQALTVIGTLPNGPAHVLFCIFRDIYKYGRLARLMINDFLYLDPVIGIKLPPHHATYIRGFHTPRISAIEGI